MKMMRRYILKSSLNVARLSRLLAKAIDFFLVLIICTIFYPFGVILGVFYWSIADALFGGQSIGKRVVGFKVISLKDGKPCSTKQSLIRNLPLSLPTLFTILGPWGIIFGFILLIPMILLELFLIFKLESTHRLGDVMADTTVIANDPEQADIRKFRESWFRSSNPGHQLS